MVILIVEQYIEWVCCEKIELKKGDIMKKNMLLFFSMIFCLHLSAHRVMMPGYENNIVDIKGLENDEGLLEVKLTFSNENPVCNYVPASFAESNDGKIHRDFIPLPDMDEEKVEQIIDRAAKDFARLGINCQVSICDAPCVGLDCLFISEGNMDIVKNIEGNVITFTVSEAENNPKEADWAQRNSVKRALSGGYVSNETV